MTTTASPPAGNDTAILALRPTMVRASAGTGKTYQLTARLLRILLQGTPPQSILATTFTRKAAGEILERILVTLALAEDERDPDSLTRLRQQLKLPGLPASRCRSLLSDLIANVHRLQICTLDSLFSNLARSFPIELQLPAGWRLTDEIEEVWLRQRAIGGLIAGAQPGELRSLLSLSSAGKITRSIHREIDAVVTSSYDRQRLCVTDPWSALRAPAMPDDAMLRKAESELRGIEVSQKSLRGKLDSLADAIAGRAFYELAEDTLIGNIAKARVAGEVVKFGNTKIPSELDGALDTLYAAVRTAVLGSLVGQNQATGALLDHYETQIHSLKQSLRVFAFDDIAVRLAKFFATLKTSDDATAEPLQELDRRLDGTIDHVLLDEFQDTSPVQWTVLKPLSQRSAVHPTASRSAAQMDDGIPPSTSSDQSVPRSFFCVGDTKQAIYAWRGGVAEIFDAVADQLPAITVVPQDKSFRSSPVVLDFVTDVFQNLDRHPLSRPTVEPHNPTSHQGVAVHRFADQFPVHVSAKTDLPGEVAIWTSADPIPEVPTPTADAGDDPAGDPDVSSPHAKPSKKAKPDNKPRTASARQKRDACFDTAAELVRRRFETTPEMTIGVLVRTNAAVAEMILRLESMGLPVSQEGGNPLVDSAAVEVLLSALMMVEHPGDGRWSYHVDATPLGASLRTAATRHNLTVPTMLRRRLQRIGLPQTLRSLADVLAPHCNVRDTVRMKQLITLAIQYQTNASPRLGDFVEMVRVKRIDRPVPAPIRVMTIHQSKGLEFDCVVLPELNSDLAKRPPTLIIDRDDIDQPPSGISRYVNKERQHFLSRRWIDAIGRQQGQAMTEALCLLYVAMTRSRQSLELVVSPCTDAAYSGQSSASLILHALDLAAAADRPSTRIHHVGQPAGDHDHASRRSATLGEATDTDAAAVALPRRIRFAGSDVAAEGSGRDDHVWIIDADYEAAFANSFGSI